MLKSTIWPVELETYRIKFVHIKGKSNVLANTLSRLINIDPDVKWDPELAGYEFGHLCFEELLKVSSYTVNESDCQQGCWSPWFWHWWTCNNLHYPLCWVPRYGRCKILAKELHQLCPCIEKGHLADSGYFIDPRRWTATVKDSWTTFKTFEPVVLRKQLDQHSTLVSTWPHWS